MEPVRTNFENSKEQLRLFYSRTLFATLSAFEKRRKEMIWTLWASVSLIILSISWWLSGGQFLIALLILTAGLIPGFLFTSKIKDFKSSFKHTIINKLLEFFENQKLIDSIQYNPTGFISKSTFQESNFIANQIFEYQGEDFFKGRINHTPFEICELMVKIKSKVSGKIHTAFHGHFLKFETGHFLEGKFWIFSKVEKSNMTNSIKEYYRLGASPIENSSFSNSFMVYHTPEFITNYVLTEELKKLLEEWNQMGTSFFLFASGSNILVAIRSTKDILEPNIFSSNKRFDKIQDLYQELTKMFGLIEAIEKGV